MSEQIIHLDKYSQDTIKEYLPNHDICNKLSGLYSIFSDSTRLKIIVALLYREICVNDLSKILNINQTTISHQLKILKSIGAVTTTRINKYIFYKVTNKIISDIMLSGIDYITQRNVI